MAGTLPAMELAITPLDPADDAVVDETLRLLDAARLAEAPDLPPPCRYWFVGSFSFPRKAYRSMPYVARQGGTIVGYLLLRLPTIDNLDNSDIELTVHPQHRHRGVGRAILEFATDELRKAGRKRTVGYSVLGLPGGPDRDMAGHRFAAATGASDALGEVRRRLVLSTVDETVLDKLVADAWPRAEGYRTVMWTGRTPDEYAADVGYLDGRMVTDAPMGDLTWEPEVVDVERIREREAQMAVQGIRAYTTGAVHEASGRLVALSALGRERSVPDHAWQWNTIVDPDHRGHRLGTIVKIENLRYARAHEPALSVIDTWNAAVNTHMISINEAMGFRPVDAWTNWELEL